MYTRGLPFEILLSVSAGNGVSLCFLFQSKGEKKSDF